jgi:16S rRNA G966 N2-methylase RsmD
MKIVTRKIDSLLPYARNARTHSDAQVAQIAASIKEFGFNNPILTHGDGVVAGHGRLLAARKIGLVEVPTVDLAHLTKTQARAYVLADNQLALGAGWDNEMLALELTELDTEGFDLDMLGFSDLEGLMAPPAAGLVPGVDEDAVPEPPKVPITKPGDIITLGRHRLRCGDSTNPQHVDELLGGASLDMVYTDPPYGMSVVQSDGKECGLEKGTVGIEGAAKRGTYAPVIGDDSTQTAIDAYHLCVALGAPVMVFWGANFYASALPDSSAWLIWDKENGEGFFADVELAWTNAKIQSRLFKHQWKGMIKASERGEKRVHPTQKPVTLAEWAFEKLGNTKDKVLDLFGGSGSTLIACEKSNRVCYMMEISPIYCDVIVTRWENATGQKAQR